ncbi:SOS regulatory protein LexA [Beggiatoa alba B18LD]|uniref:LexA repressor n=1 Tax=Beggiatoa alba B18LD TaxID=395493 RepID=I3CEG5_9GAMM|nr:SOS regulatory protein LexA [Beggiatoa alba B18LD]
MEELTSRQRQVWEFIVQQIDSTRMPPTRAEITRAFGFNSPNSAEQHLQALAKKGYIELLAGSSRGIRLLKGIGLPVIGRVAAGQPIMAEQHVEGRYQLDESLFHPRADYLLRVQGMSMRDVGILDGDLLAVHRTEKASNGQIVVARVDGNEVTVKRFQQQAHEVRLLPENTDFEPIIVDLRTQHLVIEGLGVGIIRSHQIS